MNFSLLATESFGEMISRWFYSVLYWILDCLCKIIDLCQGLVKKLAGIDAEGMLYDGQLINGSESSNTVTGDIVEVIIRSDIVRNLFISLLVLGIILLLIVTFVSVWKTEWDFGKDGNSKTKIINASLKALFNFIAVPVVAFFGIFVGNALLRAIDGATKGDANNSMRSSVLSSAFSDASRYTYKNEGNNAAWINANLQVVYETDETGNKVTDENGNFVVKAQGILNLFKDSKQDVHTDEILSAFQNNIVLTKKTVQEGKYRIFNSDGSIDNRYTSSLEAGEFKFTFDDTTLVSMFFDNSKINYILIYIILIFMIKAMLTITYGLVKRLYYVVILFIISPPIVAMSPINDKALGSWRSMFISNVCSAFVTIGIYNIYLSIYPAFAKVNFPNVGNFVNFFVQLLMISVGLEVINALSGEIAKLLGVKDLQSESVNKDGKSLWGGAFKTAGSGFKPFTLGAQAVGKGVQYGMTAHYKGLGAAVKQMGGDIAGGASKLLSKTPLDSMAQGAGLYGRDKDGKIKGGLVGQAKANHGILHSDDAKKYRAKKEVHKETGAALKDFFKKEGKGAEDKMEEHRQQVNDTKSALDTYNKYKETAEYMDKVNEAQKYVDQYGDLKSGAGAALRLLDPDMKKYDEYSSILNDYKTQKEFQTDKWKEVQDYQSNKEKYESAKAKVSNMSDADKEDYKRKADLVDNYDIYKNTKRRSSQKDSEDAVTKYTARKDAEKNSKKK